MTSDRQQAVLIDVSHASNSAVACRVVEEFIERFKDVESPYPTPVDLNGGNVLLTRSVLSRLSQQLRSNRFVLETIFTVVPQTQQAALDEGFYVKETWSESPTAREVRSFLSSGVTAPDSVLLPGEQPEPKAVPALKVEPAEETSVNILEIEITETEVTDVSAITEVPPPETPAPSSLSAKEPEPILVTTEGTLPTLYLKQTLRSGQLVRFDGNVVIVGDVHAGSEISAAGDITVWGELRGIAHAGTSGNYRAEIRAMKIEALQLRIADYIARRPDRIYYHKGQAASLPSPELARVSDGEIRIFKDQSA